MLDTKNLSTGVRRPGSVDRKATLLEPLDATLWDYVIDRYHLGRSGQGEVPNLRELSNAISHMRKAGFFGSEIAGRFARTGDSGKTWVSTVHTLQKITHDVWEVILASARPLSLKSLHRIAMGKDRQMILAQNEVALASKRVKAEPPTCSESARDRITRLLRQHPDWVVVQERYLKSQSGKKQRPNFRELSMVVVEMRAAKLSGTEIAAVFGRYGTCAKSWPSMLAKLSGLSPSAWELLLSADPPLSLQDAYAAASKPREKRIEWINKRIEARKP